MNIFGTDGIRGKVNQWPMTAELIQKVAISDASIYFGKGGSNLNRVIIGKDTRLSGYMLEPALVAGFTSMGMDCLTLGPIPTPGVSRLTRSFRADLGVMISASHNPSEDNGIKLLSAGGKKLNDDAQSEIEAILESNDFPNLTQGASYVEPSYSHLANDWVSTLRESIKDRNLSGISLVVDCANGAVSAFAANTLRELGAKVVSIHDAPDGTNINEDCGSTSLGSLRAAVRDNRADLGLAFDGDADRVLAIDRQGRVIDGDFMIAICAEDMKSRKALKDNTAVVTVMTNLGFHLAMKEKGIHVHQTPVGDRQVLAALVANDWSLGGEQSGHIIFSDLSTTGDGLLTGIQLLDIIARSNKRLDELADFAMIRYPQVLKQVNLSKTTIDIESSLAEDIANAEIELGGSGRVLVRGQELNQFYELWLNL